MTNKQRNTKRGMLLEGRRRKLMASRKVTSNEKHVAHNNAASGVPDDGLEAVIPMRGNHIPYNSMKAVIKRNTREIIRTCEHYSGRLLLDFGAGTFPTDLEQNHSYVHSPRDYRMEFSHDGSSSSVLACAEKMVAHAFIRDHLKLPPFDLILNENGGTCGGTGRFISPESVELMAFSGVAWSAYNGNMPTAAELEFPIQFLSMKSVSAAAFNGQPTSATETIKRIMSEVVWVLSRHAMFIRMLARLLIKTGLIGAYRMQSYIEAKWGFNDSAPIWDCGLIPLQQPAA